MIRAEGFGELEPTRALNELGRLIDTANDQQHEVGLARAVELAEMLRGRIAADANHAILNYYEGNAWAGLDAIRRGADSWAWERPELQREISCLRRAAQFPHAAGMPSELTTAVLTNLGNTYSSVGRTVEAIAYWDQALRVIPQFGMALGNRAMAYEQYGRLLENRAHGAIFLKRAHRDLCQLDAHVETHAAPVFERVRQQIEASLSPEYLTADEAVPEESLGRSRDERMYRKWCLREQLFLNPLNDLGAVSHAGGDDFVLSSMVTDLDVGPNLYGFFSQMKQEFTSARFLLYEGLNRRGTHFSDRKVVLLNTLDYPRYGFAVEQTKLAYRAAYSLFDKIAYFVNDYFGLGIRDDRVSFRSLWYENKGKLRPEFIARPNLPLRGLFWVSKDLFEPETGFRDAMAPTARRLHELRTRLEHRYTKIYEGSHWGELNPAGRTRLGLDDTLAYFVPWSQFDGAALDVFRLARAAMLYLGLAVGVEEHRRSDKRGAGEPLVPFFLDRWEDDWKQRW